MANSATTRFISLTLLLLVSIFQVQNCTGNRVNPETTEFIRKRCSATVYPRLCFDSLSSYASTIQTSPVQLANTALAVSLAGARSTSDLVSGILAGGKHMKPKEAAAVRDCMETLGDSMDELHRSLEAMEHLGLGGGDKLGLQMDDIQTWVSAALTNEDTCMDGFAGGEMNGDVKKKVRRHVVNVARKTSNALALINGISSAQSPSPAQSPSSP